MKELQKTFKEFTKLDEQINIKRSEMIDMTNDMLKKIFGEFLWVEATYPDEQDGMFLRSNPIDYYEPKGVILSNGETIKVVRDAYGKDNYVDLSEVIYDFFESYDIIISCNIIAMVSKKEAKKISNILTNTLAKDIPTNSMKSKQSKLQKKIESVMDDGNHVINVAEFDSDDIMERVQNVLSIYNRDISEFEIITKEEDEAIKLAWKREEEKLKKNKFYFSINYDDIREYRGTRTTAYEVALDIATLYNELMMYDKCVPPVIEIFDENEKSIKKFNTDVKYITKLVLVDKN